MQTRQLITSRGFLSAVSNTLHFGLENGDPFQLEVIWPDGKTQRLENVSVNQLLTLDHADAKEADKITRDQPTIFDRQEFGFAHIDPSFDDYQRR